MTKVFLGLISMAGDRLGHLVRGVQMLRSYGSEVDVTRYCDVVQVAMHEDQTPGLCTVLECTSDATLEGLRGICRETQWALGDEDEVLRVVIAQYGDQKFVDLPWPIQALTEHRREPGMATFTEQYDFAKLCDWGQQLTGEDADVMGEWPSATGR